MPKSCIEPFTNQMSANLGVYDVTAQYSSANMIVITRSVTEESEGSGDW
jgi:hypothetical protein